MCMYVVLSTMRQIYVFNYSICFFLPGAAAGKIMGYPGWDRPGISRLGSAWDIPVGIGLG